MRASPQIFFDAYYDKSRGVVNGYGKTVITHLKTIAAILQCTTPHYEVETHLRLFWLVGCFCCGAGWGEGVVPEL